MKKQYLLAPPGETLEALIEAAHDATPVNGLTHNFYRYPARFSPTFVRAAIKTLSEPGDLVIDPFMGGGTTLVEALALGRNVLGADISSLATFVSQVKTTLYSEEQLRALELWALRACKSIHMHHRSVVHDSGKNYRRHMDTRTTWRVRKAIEQSLHTTKKLEVKLERFGRCAILRTAQWALDGRKTFPSLDRFRETFLIHVSEMIVGARQLREATERSRGREQVIVHCLNRSTAGLEQETFLKQHKAPKLILTSPPYPGIHVLYHRWQVDGRKETPAPFWIANQNDGSGAAYYTMGDRKAHDLRTYFDNLRESLRSIAALCSEDTMVVQVMAFSEPSWQLPRYLSIADDVGLKELYLPSLKGKEDGRLWRHVPNRKWHANHKGKTHGSREVVLFHKVENPNQPATSISLMSVRDTR